ncbi:hypothetical protein ACFX2I_043042 [Malus domestica]
MHQRRRSDTEAVLSRHSRANIPFAWEMEPGLSKAATDVHHGDHRDHRVLSEHLNVEQLTLKLTPPPRLLSPRGGSARFVVVDRQSRLPLCSIQPSFRLNSFRLVGGGVRKEEDPFLAALVKCTAAKNPIGHPAGNNGKKYVGKKTKTRFSFSCKYSCDVKEDSVVKMPQSPYKQRDGVLYV